MRIGIQTWGSDGDVRPFLALAGGLAAAGHEVTLAAAHIENRDHSAEAAAMGFRYVTVGSIDRKVLAETGMRLVPVKDPIRQVALVLRGLFDPLADEMLAAATGLCRDHDIVIGHFLVHPLAASAERAKVPRIAVHLAPLIPSGRLPLPGLPDMGRFLNATLWKFSGIMLNRLFLGPVNRMRVRLGLPAARNITSEVYRSPLMDLVAASPSLVPRPPDWDGRIELCGAFVPPDLSGTAAVPERLEAFLAAGPPPVYMTFGSMLAAEPLAEDSVKLLCDAAEIAGCRAIVQHVGAQTDGFSPSKQVLHIGRAHHDSIFPRCAAVVHHGGAGTVHAAARAGVPSVVVQHATDQAFWGNVLRRQGVAARPLDRRKTTPARLAGAIRSVLTSAAMRERACRVGESMRRENGVRRAVELIGERFASAVPGRRYDP